MGLLNWWTGRTGKSDSSSSNKDEVMFRKVSGEEAARIISRGNVVVLDVRTPREYEQSHIPEAILIPLQQLPERIQDLDPQKEMLVICAGGVRSQQACRYLSQRGFQNLMNVNGGMSAYLGSRQTGRS
jgi:rhodanese-related sulfurtransferase